MAQVRLDFVPPQTPDLTELRIYEATSATGPWVQIEIVPITGGYPSYYTTDQATSKNNWFAIDWYDVKGGNLGISAPVQGGTLTLVGDIVNRMMLRDPLLDENIALQEAEATIEAWSGGDPYLLSSNDASYREKRGLTLLALARTLIFRFTQTATTTTSYTAGLVSQTAGGATTQQQMSQNIDELIKLATFDLGISTSVILQMIETDMTGINLPLSTVDQTRLLIEKP